MRGITATELPVQLVPVHDHVCIFLKNILVLKAKEGSSCQGADQSQQPREADDLASSLALSLSSHRLHPWLLRRSISGAHRKARG